jgi:hypothetical protein
VLPTVIERLQGNKGWATANFTGDKLTDVPDFNIWNQNEFLTGNLAASQASETSSGKTPRPALATRRVTSDSLTEGEKIDAISGSKVDAIGSRSDRKEQHERSFNQRKLVPSQPLFPQEHLQGNGNVIVSPRQIDNYIAGWRGDSANEQDADAFPELDDLYGTRH